MSYLEEIFGKEYDIQRYEDYSEVMLEKINNINNILLRLNNDNINCIDIDMEYKAEFIKLFNLNLIGKKITSIKSIEDVINTTKSMIESTITDIQLTDLNDKLFLFEKREERTKNKIILEILLEKFKNTNRIIPKDIPKSLHLNHKQMFEIIFSEVNKINKNFSFPHYIDFKDNDIYTLCFRFRYNNGSLSDKLKQLEKNFNCDYIEIIVRLDNSLYPFVPPTIEYSKPAMSNDVIFNIMNLSFLQPTKWNYNISLEWMITEIGKQYEKYFDKYIDISKEYPITEEIDKCIFDLFNMMGIYEYQNFNIEFNLPSFTETKKNYWASGTGYGYEGTNNWDITRFIEEQKNLNIKIIEKLNQIKHLFENCNDKDNIKQTFITFFTNQLRGTNIFDFNKNIELYSSYIDTISSLNLEKIIKPEIIVDLYEEINYVLNDDTLEKNLDVNKRESYSLFTKLFKSSISEYKQEKETVVSDDMKTNYEMMVKSQLFNSYVFDNKHLYYKNASNKITNKKNLLRLVSEISSLKKNLPINWDTSSVLRIDKKQTNMITFVITGPKDTPYHNGVYEFHAYFPPTYPNDPPQVLLNTTDGGKVRFNPNLYANGKVCLSLLGTWSGQDGEKWNGEISTFLQVIISIQSLIMVEDPYFNEPSYERSMNTPQGKQRAFAYKDNIRYQNLLVAILNQIKNPPQGYEEFTINHFKAKKDEILTIAKQWMDESEKLKPHFEEVINQISELI
jgi:ubiquitin-protein ligase